MTDEDDCDAELIVDVVAAGSAGEQSKFEQLMVNMLDERDKLVEQLRDTQTRCDELQMRIRDSEREKESLRRQIDLHLQPVPLVS